MAEERRSIVRWMVGSGLVASVTSFIYPVFRFVMPPEIPEAPVNEVSAGKVAELEPGAARIVKFGNKPVLLVRIQESEWHAFSAVCTHLNCTVQFKSDTHQIWCACHNGLYDLKGNVVSGPPPRGLEEYDVKVRNEEVVISRRA